MLLVALKVRVVLRGRVALVYLCRVVLLLVPHDAAVSAVSVAYDSVRRLVRRLLEAVHSLRLKVCHRSCYWVLHTLYLHLVLHMLAVAYLRRLRHLVLQARVVFELPGCRRADLHRCLGSSRLLVQRRLVALEELPAAVLHVVVT